MAQYDVYLMFSSMKYYYSLVKAIAYSFFQLDFYSDIRGVKKTLKSFMIITLETRANILITLAQKKAKRSKRFTD